jgi:thymidylate synthase
MRIKNWEKQFENNAKVGNLDSNVVILTLWTPRKLIENHLSKRSYCVLSQLYSKDAGLNALVRGCLSNTTIRHIVITGQDLSESGQALVNLKEKGVDDKNNILGIENAAVDREIPKEAIERFRNNVDIIDLRSTNDFATLKEQIATLEKKKDYGKAEVFPEAKVEVPDKLPGEKTGFCIRAKTVGEAWLQTLQLVMNIGVLKDTEYDDQQKEILGLNITITDEDPDKPTWNKFFNFTQKEVKEYYTHVVDTKRIKDVRYTYGGRLTRYEGIDQIKNMIEKLKRKAHSRRAIAVIWNVSKDIEKYVSPCFILVQALIQENRLHLIAYSRSADMFNAWPRNAFAFRKLQKKIAIELECEMGNLTMTLGSAHIYKKSFIQVMNRLEKYPVLENTKFDLPGKLMQDPRGNIVISISATHIKLTHETPDGKRIEEQEFKTGKDALLWLTWQQKISDIQHALYIGRELEKAEMAVKLGIHYIQDKPLHLDEIKNAQK